LRRKFAEQFADFTGTDWMYIGNTEALYLDNISAEVVKLSLETDVEIIFSETKVFFSLVGSAQQAQHPTHLAELLR